MSTGNDGFCPSHMRGDLNLGSQLAGGNGQTNFNPNPASGFGAGSFFNQYGMNGQLGNPMQGQQPGLAGLQGNGLDTGAGALMGQMQGMGECRRSICLYCRS